MYRPARVQDPSTPASKLASKMLGGIRGMVRLSLTLGGGFQARLDSRPSRLLPTRRSHALLAYLALPLGRARLLMDPSSATRGPNRTTSAFTTMPPGSADLGSAK